MIAVNGYYLLPYMVTFFIESNLNNYGVCLFQDGVWVTSADYKVSNPDPLRDFAVKLVGEINAHNGEDVFRFCNIYADLDFQVCSAQRCNTPFFFLVVKVLSNV